MSCQLSHGTGSHRAKWALAWPCSPGTVKAGNEGAGRVAAEVATVTAVVAARVVMGVGAKVDVKNMDVMGTVAGVKVARRQY